MTDAEHVRSILSYDPETGVFVWKSRPNNPQWDAQWAGEGAGFLHNQGYIRIKFKGQSHKAHRLAWLHVHGRWPNGDIDHINGIRNDNRLINIREVTRAVNLHNQKRGHRNSTSKYLGVSWHGGARKWRAQIKVGGKKHYLGFFCTELEAHAAYLSAKQELHPGYVKTDFVVPGLLRIVPWPGQRAVPGTTPAAWDW